MDRVLARSKRFQIATDGIQWIVQRRQPAGHWRAVSFVSSTKAILRRCLGEKGADPTAIAKLTAGLPECFGGQPTTARRAS